MSLLIPGLPLVLLTWAFVTLITWLMGRWVPSLIGRGVAADTRWRATLWWGVALISILAMAVSLALPLSSGSSAAIVLSCAAVCAFVGFVIVRPTRPSWRRPTKSVTVALAAMAAALGYLAFTSLGPVTNYDSGLYHLNAVRYASEFPAIPGLASLYFPFGYATAQFPLAALLGNGPWDGTGYRLLNGAVLALASLDLASRLLNRRWTWGTYILLVGLGAALVPLVAMADALVASPTADTSVLILTIIAAAYLADAASLRPGSGLALSVTLVVSGVLVMLRPTMLVFALATIAVSVLISWRLSSRLSLRRVWLATLASWILMGVVTALRDRILSGWLVYPLSFLPLEVPWRSPDPVDFRNATLAAARDPFAPDQYAISQSWEWVPAWFHRLPSQWEFWFILTGAVITLLVIVVARRLRGYPRELRQLILVMTPSTVAVLVWFLASPPSFRFAWGPIFCLLLIPLAGALQCLHGAQGYRAPRYLGRPAALLGVALVMLLVTGYSAVARSNGVLMTELRDWRVGEFALRLAIAPVPEPPVDTVVTSGGLAILVPENGSDQCWAAYPLCSPMPAAGLRFSDGALSSGFAHE